MWQKDLYTSRLKYIVNFEIYYSYKISELWKSKIVFFHTDLVFKKKDSLSQ